MSDSVESGPPEYAFTFDVIASDREGYYYDRWDRATQHKTIGTSKQEALTALWPILGEAPRGRYWKARQVGVAEDVRLLQTRSLPPA